MGLDIYHAFINRRKIDISVDLRVSKDLDYILLKEEELKEYSEKTGEDCVIGIWGYPLPQGRIEGYGIHTKKEADVIIDAQRQKKDNRIYFGTFYYDLAWFERKKERLQSKFAAADCN